MNKTVIAPIVALVLYILKVTFNIEIGKGEEAQIVDGIYGIVTFGAIIYGIFKNHKPHKKEETK